MGVEARIDPSTEPQDSRPSLSTFSGRSGDVVANDRGGVSSFYIEDLGELDSQSRSDEGSGNKRDICLAIVHAARGVCCQSPTLDLDPGSETFSDEASTIEPSSFAY